MANLRSSSNDAKSSVVVFLLCLCLACDAFPIVSFVGNFKLTSQKVVDPPQMNKDSLLPFLLKLRLSRHDFIAAKPKNENGDGQQEVELRRLARSTDDYVDDDYSNNPHNNYIYTLTGNGKNESPTQDDRYIYSTTADPSFENDTYVYITTSN